VCQKADWKAHKVICKALNVGDSKQIVQADHQFNAEKAKNKLNALYLNVVRERGASLISFSSRKVTRRIALTLFERCRISFR
jgi:hypothetical protein